MALMSMTGFGRGRAAREGITIEVEISSVNRRQFELRVSLPKGMEACDSMVHTMISRTLSRGAVTANVRLTRSSGGAPFAKINTTRARSLAREMIQVAKAVRLEGKPSLSDLVSVPGVISFFDPVVDTTLGRYLLKKALAAALSEMLAMRRKEGKHLQAAIERRVRCLCSLLKKIKRASACVAARHAENLRRRLKEAGWTVEADDSTMRKELALFADRCDVSEEITRIECHLGRMKETIKHGRAAGRTLDFICQELFREITTLGSKANDAAVASLAISFKSVLEEIREQVQNVE